MLRQLYYHMICSLAGKVNALSMLRPLECHALVY
uniref:Uncharacterized protein n=1 Tax=Arundo donax TaxID=35708 RepID=A0A0A8ZBV7_ARUDO